MKNIFIIHGSFGDSKEHYLPWLKENLEKLGNNVIVPDFPIGVGVQCYDAWKNELKKYKDKINSETIFVGRSLAPIFICKYLLENNLKVNTLISISGFNGVIGESDYDKVNKTFFLDSLKDIRVVAKNRVCYISYNDPYVPRKLLEKFADAFAGETIIKENAGHFNTDSGYATFNELLDKVKKYI